LAHNLAIPYFGCEIIIPPVDVLDVPTTSNAASGSFENVGADEEQGTCIHYLN